MNDGSQSVDEYTARLIRSKTKGFVPIIKSGQKILHVQSSWGFVDLRKVQDYGEESTCHYNNNDRHAM